MWGAAETGAGRIAAIRTVGSGSLEPGSGQPPAGLCTFGVCLHLDIPRAPEGPPAPLPVPAASCPQSGLHVPPLGPFHKQTARKASKVGERSGS